MIEEVSKSSIDDVVQFHKKLGQSFISLIVESLSEGTVIVGGYFKRFRGGTLQPWVQHPDYRDMLTLEERVTLTFLQVNPSFTIRCTHAY